MNAFPTLTNAAINLTAIREHGREELKNILKSMHGAKALVLDNTLSGPLGLIAEVDFLRKYDVEKIFLLTEDLSTDIDNIIYLVRPNIALMKLIAGHIHKHKSDSSTSHKSYGIYFVPRKTMLCERVLAETGVLGDVQRGAYHLDLIPFEEDVLSLELNESFRDVFLDGDPTSLFYVAQSLMKMQSIFGIIPVVKGKGDHAHHVWNLMNRMRREPTYQFSNSMSEIDCLILIDRTVDMITPMMTQLTYEGLIDEIFGIKNSYIDWAENESSEGSTRKLPLNSSDTMFKEIRDMNFQCLGPYFKEKAEVVKKVYDKRHVQLSVREMHDFMGEFKVAHSDHSFLQTHINLAERISRKTKSRQFKRHIEIENSLRASEEIRACEDYIEECIAKQEPLHEVLRLVCLLALTSGIKSKKYDLLKRELIHTYGFETMFTIQNLEKLGLFKKQVRRPIWPSLRKVLRLLPEEVNLSHPTDINFAYNGYAPLSVRIVELAARGGWKRISDVMDALPGKRFEYVQDVLPHGTSSESSMGTSSGNKKPLTLVYFIGGITFAEISAFRHLNEQETGRDYLIATTKLINGNTMLQCITEKIVNNLDKNSIYQT